MSGVDARYLGLTANQLAKIATDLKVKNTQLRELVQISIEYCNSGCCDGCPIQTDDGNCPYADIARELGVEVDE